MQRIEVMRELRAMGTAQNRKVYARHGASVAMFGVSIERDIHTAKNRVRDAMNSALIAIGNCNGHLKERALAAAARIGKVEVDYGETGCKTPDAAEYIRKASKRKHAC